MAFVVVVVDVVSGSQPRYAQSLHATSQDENLVQFGHQALHPIDHHMVKKSKGKLIIILRTVR